MTDAAETPLAELAHLRRRVLELESEVTALRASEVEQQAMFAAMTDAVLIVDRDGRYLRVPETASDARHKPDPRLLGKTMHDALPAAEADGFVAGIRRVLAERRMLNNVYSRTIAGEELWFSANVSPLGADTVLLVVREITDEVRHEQALRDNVRQQERLREHEAALLRLSTPLIPIGDDLLVVPLIGRLDAARLEHTRDMLLNGIASARARVAIVDVTGIAELDEAAAAGLLKVAQAVRLLGARVVLTGIRPRVAAALASSAAAWTDVTVRASLKEAVAEATSDARHAP